MYLFYSHIVVEVHKFYCFVQTTVAPVLADRCIAPILIHTSGSKYMLAFVFQNVSMSFNLSLGKCSRKSVLRQLTAHVRGVMMMGIIGLGMRYTLAPVISLLIRYCSVSRRSLQV